MSDATDNSEEEASSSEQGPLGGEGLAEARRAQQISVLEIAKELHLDEPKVRALERNEFDVLGAPVFAKATCANTHSWCRSTKTTSWLTTIS